MFMPLLENIQGEAPETIDKNAASENNSNSSTPLTPITNSTSSSLSSLNSASPESSALFRIISNPYENGQENLLTFEIGAFPREQNLLDLLIQSSGVDNIHQLRQLREVRLRVVASTISLSRLEVYTPYIRTLRLDGSGLTSLREIGTSLNHLKVLHVSRCGLTNLDGTFGLTNLIELYAADNYIENVGPCAILDNIRVINLDRNPLKSIVNVSLLSLCPNLMKLSTKETPVSKYQGYRKIIKEFMPNLKKLDGEILNDGESVEESLDDANDESYKSLDGNLKTDDTASCSIEVSSLTEPSSEDNDDNSPVSKLTEDFVSNHVNIYAIKRPATAPTSSCVKQSLSNHRPCTAFSKPRDTDSVDQPVFPDSTSETSPSFLTSGGIVCGNIARALSRARPPQKPTKPSSSKPFDPWIIGPPIEDKQSLSEQRIDSNMNNSTISSSSSSQESQSSKLDHLKVLEEAKKLIDEPLPTKPIETTPVVDLELGIAGMVGSDPLSIMDPVNKWDESSEKALRVSKQWRKAFKLYRRQRKISTILENDTINSKDE